MDRIEGGRPPEDHRPWPPSQDPFAAELGEHEPRSFALWPTPVSRPCPEVAFGPLSPEMESGDLFERTSARLTSMSDPWRRMEPTEVVIVRDHVALDGLRLVLAAHTPGVCMKSWRHTHCFVSDEAVYCPDGTVASLERLVRDHRLGPRSLSESAWFQLAVVLADIEAFVVEPSLVHECTTIPGATALWPRVDVRDDGVTVQLTSVDYDRAHDHSIEIARDGRVRHRTVLRWADQHRHGDDLEFWALLREWVPWSRSTARLWSGS